MSSRAFWAEQADLIRSNLFNNSSNRFAEIDNPKVIVKFKLDRSSERKVGFDYIRDEWITGVEKPEFDNNRKILGELDKNNKYIFKKQPVCTNPDLLKKLYEPFFPYMNDLENVVYGVWLSIFPDTYVKAFKTELSDSERTLNQKEKTPDSALPKSEAIIDWSLNHTNFDKSKKKNVKFLFEVSSEGVNKIKIKNTLDKNTDYSNKFLTPTGKVDGTLSVVCLEPIDKKIEITVKTIWKGEQEDVTTKPIGKILVYPNKTINDKIRIININPIRAIIDERSSSNIDSKFNPIKFRNFLNENYFHQFLCHCSFKNIVDVPLNSPTNVKGLKLISDFDLTKHSGKIDLNTGLAPLTQQSGTIGGPSQRIATIANHKIHTDGRNSDHEKFRKILIECVKETLGDSMKMAFTERYIVFCDLYMQYGTESERKGGGGSVTLAESDKPGPFTTVYCEIALSESTIAHEIGHGLNLNHTFDSGTNPEFYQGYTNLVMDYSDSFYYENSSTSPKERPITAYSSKLYYTKLEWDIIQKYLNQ